MCEPSTALIAVAGVTAASGGLTAYGQVQEGKAAERAGRYRAQVARNNSIRAQQAAADARRRGELEAQRIAEQNRQLRGRQRVAAAALGQDVNEGSAALLQEDTLQISGREQQIARANAARESAGLLAQAENFQAEGELERFKGLSARRASKLAAGGTLLGTAGSVAKTWYGFGS